MKVSVVIPVYNEEKYVGKCLESLFGQSEKADEIIVVDNNCTDSTVPIVKKYPLVKVVKEAKQGMIPARNKGFDSAKGEIIVKCDADSLLPRDWIKNIKKDFADNPEAVALSMPVVMYDLPGGYKSKPIFYLYMLSPRLIIGVYPLAGPGYAIKKSSWKKVKNDICLNDKEVHEDIDLTFHVKKVGPIIHDPKTVVMSSARRIKSDPLSFFGEYTMRFLKMVKTHVATS